MELETYYVFYGPYLCNLMVVQLLAVRDVARDYTRNGHIHPKLM
jgi:hypothetical protein